MNNRKINIIAVNGSSSINSLSWKVNQTLVDLLNKKYDCDITTIDLNKTKLANNILNSNNISSYWNDVDSDYYIDLLKKSDLLVLNTPMNNFSYSILVKSFIDAISVANKTFSYKYSKKGDAIGLINNLKVILIFTQGSPEGWYPFANYVSNLEGIFNFLGVKEIHSLVIDGTKVAPRNAMSQEEIIEEFKDKIISLSEKLN
ncbi:FMN-dependent NADH-azoreductase [Mycoplasmopsis meleagridis]|uniref:FMN-dependent NADH-azoreductase n=1 Tax=Mycoplasmopsis meleagridis ATCC 25294 TaxID=1264554 RepID=A0A0F5H115_9BACT|nr:FMN-dependent NADH-azoreductase [Mycoplasmopsis meleagridis]KKB26994.1 FMN-dependent NADH-azoreductase [Mycoplasmopsis meleagridis ATCC 25294]OAD18341.1 FMN-dependent NADH-azoreductase [Mycoplasmopsis meleagridis]VEU77471.1 FMN-dependent NADH-azoreductase [Mycoplasmopsis meleagridis]